MTTKKTLTGLGISILVVLFAIFVGGEMNQQSTPNESGGNQDIELQPEQKEIEPESISQLVESPPKIEEPPPPKLESTTTEPSPVIETPEIEPPVYDFPECSGNALCFSGTVTRVTDGDSINVDDRQVRFAMASAPELDEYDGVEARKLIDTLCPVDSIAQVDEDDGQTQGSHGRILGEVHCNGWNLNSELLDSGIGYLLTEFCSESEFATTNWAQKYGCNVVERQDFSLKGFTSSKQDCDPSYPDVCIPTSPPDLDCADVPYRKFTVLPPDPHRFYGDKDGIGCESN